MVRRRPQKIFGAAAITLALGVMWIAQQAPNEQTALMPCVYYHGTCIPTTALSTLMGPGVRMVP
ncbi:hypothetical protein BH160DRAFT_2865 [Burkholderia sp. H160]|nr:hypothetical protein BH160DRAFT_2865 [Burkholderia sp. H160]